MSLLIQILILVLMLPAIATAWTVEGSIGSALNFSTNLEIEQEAFPDLEIDADYDTRGFEGPLYYAVRVGREDHSGAWEVEFIHHKIFLQDETAQVQRFSISHGFNFLLFNRAWNFHRVTLRAGGGAIIAHPESRIRNMDSEPGYEWTGPAGQFSISHRFLFGDRFFLSIEGKLTAARAVVTIANGKARAPNFALHGLAGFGFTID